MSILEKIPRTRSRVTTYAYMHKCDARYGIIRVENGRSQRAARLDDTGRPSRGSRLATPATPEPRARTPDADLSRPVAKTRLSGSTADGFRTTDRLFTIESSVLIGIGNGTENMHSHSQEAYLSCEKKEKERKKRRELPFGIFRYLVSS